MAEFICRLGTPAGEVVTRTIEAAGEAFGAGGEYQIVPGLDIDAFAPRLSFFFAIGMPIAYEVDGTQYIAVQSGWDGDARGMANNVARFFPNEVPSVPQGGAVWVFALE